LPWETQRDARPFVRALEGVDERVEQPGIHQGAEHVSFVQVFPRPGHGRLVPDAALLDDAVHHHSDIHRHALTGLFETRGLQDARCADPASGQDDRPGPRGERLPAQASLHSHCASFLDQHALHARPGLQVAPGSDGLVHVFGRVPFCAAAAAQHALGAAVEFVGARRFHEFQLRFPGVAQRLRGLRDARGGFPAQRLWQRFDVQFFDRLRNFVCDIDPVFVLHPIRRRRGAATIHAGGAAYHERPHDIQALLGEEHTSAVGIQQGAQVSAVIPARTVVPPALQKQYTLARAG